MSDNRLKESLMGTETPEVVAETVETKDLAGQEYGTKLEARRWLILIAFSIFSASNAMQWITYSPITTKVQEYYGKEDDDSAILQFPNSYMYIYFALSFLGSWFAYRWFTWSFLGALLLNTVGGWVRYASGHNYSGALFGQYLAALAQNVVLFVPVLISDRWFPVHERTWAVSIGTLANLFGWGFGFLFPTLIVKDHANQIRDLLLYEAIIASVPLAIGVISVRERPKIPPSYSALVKLGDHDSFWKEFKEIIKNVKFMVAAICFGNLIGQSYTISSVITLFMDDYTLTQQGLVGVVFIGSGIIGGLIGTWYLGRGTLENYDPILKIFMVISMAGMIALAFFIHKDSIRDLYILNAVLGVGLLGFQPFACQSLVEMTFPVQESISVNMMMVMGQLFGLIGNLISTAKFVGDEGIWSLVVIVAPSVLYILFFHKTETKRQKAEGEHQRIDQGAINTIVHETIEKK